MSSKTTDPTRVFTPGETGAAAAKFAEAEILARESKNDRAAGLRLIATADQKSIQAQFLRNDACRILCPTDPTELPKPE